MIDAASNARRTGGRGVAVAIQPPSRLAKEACSEPTRPAPSFQPSPESAGRAGGAFRAIMDSMNEESRWDYPAAGGYAVAVSVALLVVPPSATREWPLTSRFVLVLGVAVLVFTILLFRRRPAVGLPMLGAVIVLALGANAGPVGILLLFEFVYAATVYAHRRLRLAAYSLAVVVNVVLIVLPFVMGPPSAEAVVAAGQTLVLSILAAWWGQTVRFLRERAESEQAAVRVQTSLAAKERELSEASSALAVAAERIRVARDIHDLVAGRLAVISLQAGMAQSHIYEADSTAARIRDIRECSDATLGSVRAMISALSQDKDSVDRIGLIDGAAHLKQTVAAVDDAGVHVRLEDRLEKTECPRTQTLYIVAQEVVVNMVRHGAPCQAEVRLDQDDGMLTLVAWNTPGDDPLVGRLRGTAVVGPPAKTPTRTPGGQGLRNIRDRIAPLGGLVSVELMEDPPCFTVKVRIPTGTSHLTTMPT